MRKLVQVLMLFATLIAFTVAAPADKAEARMHGSFSGAVIIGSPFIYDPFWDPWYDPWYRPAYPYYYAPPANYGFLKTKVEPKDTEVWVDGQVFGVADDFDSFFHALKLPLGVHRAQFKLEGYKTFAVSFTVTPDDTTTIKHKMTPATGAARGEEVGRLIIRTDPTGADVYIDGQHSFVSGRKAENLELASGRHQIRVTKEGYNDYVADTVISDGGEVNMDVELKEAE
ncbi:MAG TPA: PEGA domain-containing protein [Nitrospirota bacterium]|jgi:hypothetical protein